LGIEDEEQLQLYPKFGSDWEGFALEEIIKEYHASFEECYFWSTQAGAELDLLIIKDGKRLCVKPLKNKLK
jgi:predicted AAA+ superfamily ATPase